MRGLPKGWGNEELEGNFAVERSKQPAPSTTKRECDKAHAAGIVKEEGEKGGAAKRENMVK